MAWWAPWTWFRGNKEEELVEEPGLPPEFKEKKASSWLKPWTWNWFRRGEEEFEEVGPVGEEWAYRPTAERPTLEEARKPFAEEEIPTAVREKPSKGVLVEEEELEVFPPPEEYPGGLYISDGKVTSGFKKFCLALFSIFLLPFILVFGVCLLTCAFLLIFPMLMAFFPIFLIGLFMLFIIVPVALPVLIVYVMVTERLMLLINSKGHFFSLQGVPAGEEKIPEE
jgi:hypothetical protein